MRRCIWCLLTEPDVTFENLTHSIPKALGGKSICKNVCDSCNSYFGNQIGGYPSVEAIIKETFNVSRVGLLDTQNQIGKNKALPKISSIYFDIDIKRHKIKLKSSYSHNKGFQEDRKS